MLVRLEELAKIREWARREGLSVGLTNGAFDLLHVGHADHLLQASHHCDLLFVVVNSDASVKAYKGPTRPILPEVERARLVAALRCVDYVAIFDDANACAIVQSLDPDVYVKDDAYQRDLPEARYARRVEWTTGRIQCTTDIIERCRGVLR